MNMNPHPKCCTYHKYVYYKESVILFFLTIYYFFQNQFKKYGHYYFYVVCAVLAIIFLTACAPKQGTIIEKDYDSAYFIYHPSTTSCSGKPVTCRTTPGYQQYIPENFGIKIEAANGDTGWRSVSEKTYAKIEIGDYYDNGMITHSR